jgi:hypothetical protein
MRSLMHKIELSGLTLFMVIAVFAGQAAAQAPKPNVFDGGNRWLITAFDDSSTVHAQWATQGHLLPPLRGGRDANPGRLVLRHLPELERPLRPRG